MERETKKQELHDKILALVREYAEEYHRSAAWKRGGRIPWPPGEDAGKGEVPVPEPAPADAYCQHEHEVRGAQALVQFSGTSFR